MSRKTYTPRSCGECMYVVRSGRDGDDRMDATVDKRCGACYFRRLGKAVKSDDPHMPFAG